MHKLSRRKSTNMTVIVPSLATWMSNTLLSSASQKNRDPTITKFCYEAAKMGYLTPEPLMSICSDGIILIQILNCISESIDSVECIPKFNKSPKSGKALSKFKKLENLQLFLKKCRNKFNLRDGQLFEAGDLDAGRNTKGFILSLRSLQRIAPVPGPPKAIAPVTPITSVEAPKKIETETEPDTVAATSSVNGSQHARTGTVLPSGWGKHYDDNYERHYYFHDEMESTSWEHPDGSYGGSTGVSPPTTTTTVTSASTPTLSKKKLLPATNSELLKVSVETTLEPAISISKKMLELEERERVIREKEQRMETLQALELETVQSMKKRQTIKKVIAQSKMESEDEDESEDESEDEHEDDADEEEQKVGHHNRTSTKLPPNWNKYEDEQYKRNYYVNSTDGTTQWIPPEGSTGGSAEPTEPTEPTKSTKSTKSAEPIQSTGSTRTKSHHTRKASAAAAARREKEQQQQAHARTTTQLPEGWFSYKDDSSGRNYYFQPEESRTEWVPPEGSTGGSAIAFGIDTTTTIEDTSSVSAATSPGAPGGVAEYLRLNQDATARERSTTPNAPPPRPLSMAPGSRRSSAASASMTFSDIKKAVERMYQKKMPNKLSEENFLDLLIGSFKDQFKTVDVVWNEMCKTCLDTYRVNLNDYLVESKEGNATGKARTEKASPPSQPSGFLPPSGSKPPGPKPGKASSSLMPLPKFMPPPNGEYYASKLLKFTDQSVAASKRLFKKFWKPLQFVLRGSGMLEWYSSEKKQTQGGRPMGSVDLSKILNVDTLQYEQTVEEAGGSLQKKASWFGKSRELEGNLFFLEVRRGPAMLLTVCCEDRDVRDGWDDAITACIANLKSRGNIVLPSPGGPPGKKKKKTSPRGTTPPGGPPGKRAPPGGPRGLPPNRKPSPLAPTPGRPPAGGRPPWVVPSIL